MRGAVTCARCAVHRGGRSGRDRWTYANTELTAVMANTTGYSIVRVPEVEHCRETFNKTVRKGVAKWEVGDTRRKARW